MKYMESEPIHRIETTASDLEVYVAYIIIKCIHLVTMHVTLTIVSLNCNT